MQKLLQLLLHTYCDRRQNCPNSSYSLQKLLRLCTKGFVTKEFLDLHCLDKLKNFTANIFLKLVCQSHTWIRTSIGQSRTWSYALKEEIVITLQVQLCIGVRVQLQIGIGTEIPLLVTACCDNSEFSGVVTLKSLSVVFAMQIIPIHKPHS